MRRSSRRVQRLVVALPILVLAACAPRPSTSTMAVGAHTTTTTTMVDAGTAAAPPAGAADLGRLTALHTQRTHAGASGGGSEYVLGPGDVLTVRAWDLDSLNQKVRVDGDGNVTLPLLESVPVAGHTVAEVQRDLTTRLGNFMYEPHVDVFVEEYRSQQVAVLGAVQKPGLVNQTNRDGTVLDAISAAGGTLPEASSRLYLIPVESRVTGGGATAPLTGATDADAALAAGGAPIAVDTRAVTPEAQRLLYTLPVRGGDVIVVPRAGHFVVEGWVEKPGTYAAEPGITLRGAIASAGGVSFPADTGHVRVIRSGPNGAAQVRDVDYAAVTSQRTQDVFIEDGDVIEVASAKEKLVPYGMYKAVTDLFRIGAGIRVAP